jgi:AcrR family transcriptional regulator
MWRNTDELASTADRPMGRPPRISREMIIEVAREIGFEHFTMVSVADRLGVAVSALYRHVTDRDELSRLVTESWMEDFLPLADHGQHWAELARDLARLLFDTFTGNPALLIEQIRGGFSAISAMLSTETFLRLIVARGFSPSEALALAQDVRATALGAAVAVSGSRAWDWEDAFGEAQASDMPLISAAQDDFVSCFGRQSWQPTLARLLEYWARKRDETLPPRLFDLESDAIRSVHCSPH